MQKLDDRLLIAIPKKGRLYARSDELLKKIGIEYVRSLRSDIALSNTFHSAVVFLPAKDIPYYIAGGKIDLAITGEDVILEAGVSVTEHLRLDFGKCRLCLLTPNFFKSDFKKNTLKTVVSSFPNLTRKFFENQSLPVPQIVHLSGSVESSCALGIADSVVDLVQTGATIELAGLKIVEELMSSEAVLISNKKSVYKENIEKIVRRLYGVLTAEQFLMIEYNILKADLEKGEKITPGKKSPTVMPLEDSGWVAVKAMIKKTETHRLIEELKAIGAQDILVYTIQNCDVF